MRKFISLLILLCFFVKGFGQTISPIGPINLCPGDNQILTVSGTTGSPTFQWKLGGTNITGATASTYNVTNTGSYTVQVNGSGPAVLLGPVLVTVQSNPIASFSSSPNSQCGTTPVSFTNTSTGTGLSYSWDFGDPNSGANNLSTASQPSHRFVGTPGNGTQSFTVTLTVTTAFGCTASATNTVITKQLPDLTLGGPGLTIYNNRKYFRKCSNATSAQFDFTNQSTTIPTNTFYRIVFGDASPDYTDPNFVAPASHIYNVGTYTLLFIVTGQNGCIDTATYYVFVGSNPAVGLGNPGNTAICTASVLTFPISSTATNPPGTIYTVTFNDGTAPVSFPHPAPTDVSHNFLITSCGTNSTGYPNSFSATIQASNPCNSSTATVVPIYVSERPVAEFTISPNDTVCVNSTVNFNNTSGSASEIDNGNCIPGKFIWTVTPATGWTVASGVLGNDFGLADPSTWLSGSTSLNLNFNLTGTYSIKLRIGNLTCGEDFIIKTICVNPTPTGSFSLNQNIGCAPLSVNTTTIANTPLCGTNKYLWNVNYASTAGCTPTTSNFIYLGGTNSTSAQPQFQFINPGIYTLELLVISPAAACTSAVATQVVTVKGKPVASFSSFPASICVNSSITPAATVTCYTSANTYVWSFPGGTPSTSSSANPGAIVYSTAGPYTVSLAVTNECGTTTITQPLTVQAVTASNAGTTQTLCGSSVTMAGNTAVQGIGTWTQLSGPVIGNIVNPASPVTVINGLSVPGAYVFTWTINNSGCISATNVTINISSGPTVSNAGTDQNICLATTATLTANNAVTGTGQWTQVSGPAGATITSPTTSTTTVTGLVVGVYDFRWTISFSNCVPSTDDVSVTISNNPSASAAGSDQVICSTTTTLAGNNPAIGTGTWSQISGPNTATITTPGSPNTTVNGLVTGTYIFQWTISNGNCPVTNDQVQVTVTATPTTAVAGADQAICNVSSATLGGNTAVAGVGTWTFISGPNIPTITNINLASTTVTGLIPGIYIFRWTIANGNCPSTFDETQVSIFANATTAIAGPAQTVCGTSVTMAANAAVTGTGSWSQLSGSPATITSPNSPTTTVTGLSAGNYSFTWTITNGTCVSSSNVNITISAGPTTANAGTNQDLCLATSATLSGNTAVVGTGQWSQISGPVGAIITSPASATTTVTGLVVGIYVFRWTISFSNCTPSIDDVTVTIFDNPTSSAAGTDQTICSASTILAANTAAIGSGLWTQFSGPGTATIVNPASANTGISGLVVGTYVFEWTISNGNCPASVDQVQIVVTDIPTVAAAGTDQSLCASTTASLNGNTALSGTGTWTQVSGVSATIVSPNLATTIINGLLPGVYVFRWTIGNGVCPSTFDDVQVTIYENVTPSAAGSQQVICGTTATMIANTPVIGTGLWSQVSGPNTPVITNSSSPVTTLSGLITGSYIFTWTISNGTCVSASSVNIIISSGASLSNAGANQDLCLATSTVLNGNAPAVGAGQWTQVSGPNSAVFTNSSLPGTAVTGLVVGTYVFRWTISFSNCTPSVDDVQVIIFDNPSASNAGANQNICIPNAQLAANTPVIGTGNWSQFSGPNTASITDVSSQASTVSGLTGGDYLFIWTISNGPCPAQTDTVQITYSTIGNNIISGSNATCINTIPPSITGSTPTGSVGGYVYQWQQSTDAGINWNDIAGANSINYSPGTLVISTCYRRIVTTIQCTGAQGDPSAPLCITVNPDSRALFSASSTLLCAPVNLDTLITVTAFPLQNLQYNWYQNNILITGTVNGLPPSFLITSPGQTVVIKLVTTSLFGCKPDSMEITFTTRPAVIVNFIKDTISGCGSLPVNFTNTSSILNNSIEYYWDFGNGATLANVIQPPSTIIYLSSPVFRDTTYYITLKAFNGCDTTYKRDSVKVYANPKARFATLSSGCSPFRDTIVNSSFGEDAFTSYFWDFGDGTTDTTFTNGTLYHNYITGIVDTITIQLIMQNRCGRDTQLIDVIISPSNIIAQVSINGSELYGCAPHTVNFQNSSVGASLLHWDFGDGTPIETVPNSQSVVSHTYFSGGIFNIQVTLENGCSDTTVNKQITVYDAPVASFSLLNTMICTGGIVSTNNTSTNANSYEWFWGDASSTAGFNASHTYPNAGIYFVTLVARRVNVFGVACTDTSAPVQVTVVDRIPAVIDISPSNSPCVPYTIAVSANGAAAAAQVTWYFYDSNTAPGIFQFSGPTASYIYNSAGVDSVKLVVENTAGCKDSTVKVFTVNETPIALFTPVNIKTCNTDTTVTFNVAVNYAGTDPVNFEWFVNDISSGNSNPFTYQFQAPAGITAANVFNIRVLVKNSVGCGDTVNFGKFTIQTLGPRDIVVSPSYVQSLPNTTFTFSDTAQNLPSMTYLWFTGDRNNTEIPGREITYTYGDTGVYHVRLTVTDYETGCLSTDSVKVYVLAVPGYLYVPNAFCPGCRKVELRQFLPLGKGLKDYYLVIYNTWGQKVFETRSLDANGIPNQPWTGNWKTGENVQQGAFSWHIEAHYINGAEWKGMLNPKSKRLEKQGFISVIR